MLYILEDDDSIRTLVRFSLDKAGYEVRAFSNPADFLRAFEETLPDLCILDVCLPGEDGFSVLAKVREVSSLPVMMLTALSGEHEKVEAFSGGADDYVTKPFGVAELVARVGALLRRTRPASKQIKIAEMTIFPEERRICVRGEEIALTAKEYDLLLFLASNPEKVFDRETLLETVWGYGIAGGSRTVDNHVKTLRAKLGEAAECIVTVRGAGYKCTAP